MDFWLGKFQGIILPTSESELRLTKHLSNISLNNDLVDVAELRSGKPRLGRLAPQFLGNFPSLLGFVFLGPVFLLSKAFVWESCN